MDNFSVASIRNWFSVECVCEAHRALGGCVESAWRNLVIQIARCNRQKPCRPNRDVHLGHRYVHFAVVKAVDVTETRSCTGATKPRKPPGTNNEPRPSPASGAVGTSASWAVHGTASDITPTTKALRTRYRANVVSPRIAISMDSSSTRQSPSANLVARSDRHASGDGNGDAGAQFIVNTPEFAFFSAIAAQTGV